MSVTLERRDSIALVLVDRPPVNAIDVTVRAGLIDAVRRASADPAIEALVIACRGRTFMSGADLGELGSAIAAPGYGETLAAIESCPKLVVAAIHGTALGGGLELAMACHYRCANVSARVGMPEITLGILPGAGGTQRLPRLAGFSNALEMLLDGAPISAARAQEIGLIDEIVGNDVIEAGVEVARRLSLARTAPRRTRDLAVTVSDSTESSVHAALKKTARTLKGRTTQHAVIRAVRAAVDLPFDQGLALEAELSAGSLETLESRALRHVFFAERECARIPGVQPSSQTFKFTRAAVIGAGTMGSGIAMSMADAGIATLLIERDPAALARGLRGIRENYEKAAQRGRLDAAAVEARMGLIEGSLDLGAAHDVSVAIEAVFEDLALKTSILRELDRIIPAAAILASNTSSLSLTALSEATRTPARVVGLHFFSPANIMRLLEIVRGKHTSDETIQAGLALAKLLRKTGVVVGDGFGFVGNRMMLDGYFREAELMLLQGVAPERIDAVMEDFGFAMGPNKVNDMAGIDVGTKVRTELIKREQREPPYHVVSDALTAIGRLGQKSGRGIYKYLPGDRTPVSDSDVTDLIGGLAARHGVSPLEVTDAEIEQRCVLSLVNIGAEVLREGHAYRASDIDVIWTSGYGFPRFRGGPMFYADSLGLDRVVEQISKLREKSGSEYWRVSPLLLELAARGGKLADSKREPGR